MENLVTIRLPDELYLRLKQAAESTGQILRKLSCML